MLAVRISLRRTFLSRSASTQSPHGGKLIDLMVKDKKQQEDLLKRCEGRKIALNERQACDTELLVNGAFSPLDGFMNKATYDSVVDNMRLPGSNLLFGLPVNLDTNDTSLNPGQSAALTYKGETLGVVEINDKWEPNKPKEAQKCYLTTSLEHPGVQMLAMEKGKYYLGGSVKGFKLPVREFPCKTPAEVREELPTGKDVVVFQCRNPVHRAHYELFIRSLDAPNVGKDAVVMVHPTVGPTQADDIPGIVRFHTYEVLKKELNNPRVLWNYLPYSMHMAGPREAIMHMLIRKNYGCTHFIIGRDMAGSKSSLTGKDFYGPYDAQEFAIKHSEELGVKTVPSLNLVYTAEEGYVVADEAKGKIMTISGTKFRQMLRAGDEIPEWFAFKSVVNVLRQQAKEQS